jgi:hypothetical protein
MLVTLKAVLRSWTCDHASADSMCVCGLFCWDRTLALPHSFSPPGLAARWRRRPLQQRSTEPLDGFGNCALMMGAAGEEIIVAAVKLKRASWVPRRGRRQHASA